MASLGIITGILKFGDSATALMLTIFALQDSFGTACNVTGDGALTLILTGYARYHNIREQKIAIKVQNTIISVFFLRYDGLIFLRRITYLHLSYALQSYTYR